MKLGWAGFSGALISQSGFTSPLLVNLRSWQSVKIISAIGLILKENQTFQTIDGLAARSGHIVVLSTRLSWALQDPQVLPGLEIFHRRNKWRTVRVWLSLLLGQFQKSICLSLQVVAVQTILSRSGQVGRVTSHHDCVGQCLLSCRQSLRVWAGQRRYHYQYSAQPWRLLLLTRATLVSDLCACSCHLALPWHCICAA